LKEPIGREFEIDRSCERFLLTMNPGGFLRRVAAPGS
jgi:cephalosporin hydroxylase